MSASVLESMLTTSQAGRVLGISDQTVRLMLKRGRLSYTPTPYGALIDRADCERLAAERRARQSAGSPDAAEVR
jgi:excisionase family DNA binding protein